VYESRSPAACNERGLVLLAIDIPYELVTVDSQTHIVVPAEFEQRARFELQQFESENKPARARKAQLTPVYQNAYPGVIAYALVLSVVTLLAGNSIGGIDWFAAGRVDGELIRNGEWWRTITALTLHSGLAHFAGNIGFGILFGFLAGRFLGSGVAWLAIVVSAGAANMLNTLVLESAHRSIGASTAVFAALGLVAGFVWRARIMSQARWAYRLGPIIAGIALLAYTGTGDENTDIGAHVAGFGCGFASGIMLTLLYGVVPRRVTQLTAAATALLILASTWLFAISSLQG